MAGMPEMQELKRVTELRSKLRAVSEAGGWVDCQAQSWVGGVRLPPAPQAEDPLGGLPFVFLSSSWLRPSPDMPTISQRPR